MKIKYIHKMVNNFKAVDSLKLIEYDESDLPDNIIQIIKTHGDLSKSNTFGKKDLGDPQEYEKLIIEDSPGTREFEYYNKGIYFMMKGGEDDRPVFQVFAHLMTKERK